MGWGEETPEDQGIALLPALQLFNVPSQSVIDYTYYVVPRPFADPGLKPLLESLAAAAPAPAVYGPQHAFTGELAGIIVAALGRNVNAPGVRTRSPRGAGSRAGSFGTAGRALRQPDPGRCVHLAGRRGEHSITGKGASC